MSPYWRGIAAVVLLIAAFVSVIATRTKTTSYIPKPGNMLLLYTSWNRPESELVDFDLQSQVVLASWMIPAGHITRLSEAAGGWYLFSSDGKKAPRLNPATGEVAWDKTDDRPYWRYGLGDKELDVNLLSGPTGSVTLLEADGTVATRRELPGFFRASALDRTSNTLWVSSNVIEDHTNFIYVLDASTLGLKATIPVTFGGSGESIALVGSKAYVAYSMAPDNQEPGYSVAVIDQETYAIREVRLPIPYPHEILTDGQRLYVTHYDTATAQGDSISVIVNEEVIKTWHSGVPAYHATLANSHLYILGVTNVARGDGEIAVLSTDSGEIEARVRLPKRGNLVPTDFLPVR
ncbi:MAG: YncE family protein [Symbiobacteriia bacterium]